MQTGPALITSLTADKLRRGAERPKMGKPDWRQLVRQFPHIGGTLQLQYYCVLLAARGQLHYETNDFIYLVSQPDDSHV